MTNVDTKWLILFVAQLGAGIALLFLGGDGTRELGIGLIGGAFGQGMSANSTLLK